MSEKTTIIMLNKSAQENNKTNYSFTINPIFIVTTLIIAILCAALKISIGKIQIESPILSEPTLATENNQYKKYRLSDGENIFSIAHKHNISVHELNKLNEKKFTKSQFYSLKSGDEIHIPLKPLTLIISDNIYVEKK